MKKRLLSCLPLLLCLALVLTGCQGELPSGASQTSSAAQVSLEELPAYAGEPYVELDGNTANNLEAFETVVRYMAECGVGYGSINHPVDRDPVCGYNGIIDEECPGCGRREFTDGVGFERIRRITGYLVGTLDRFNDAKRAEERDRVKHHV